MGLVFLFTETKYLCIFNCQPDSKDPVHDVVCGTFVILFDSLIIDQDCGMIALSRVLVGTVS